MNQSYLKTKLFLILLLLFCLPLLYPGLELFIIYGQIVLIVPLYLLLNFSTSSDFVKVQIVIFFFLTLLAFVGMPGSIIGWMGMVCCGYLFGTRAARSQIKARKELIPFIYCSIIVTFTVLLRNARENFSYELLSDYFSSSSINTVPILAGVSFNLYCALSFYRLSQGNQRSGKLTKQEVLILFTLGVLGILTTIVFDFRSGFLIAFTVTLLALKLFAKSWLGRIASVFMLFYFLFVMGLTEIVASSVGFITQGTGDFASVTSEISSGSLRFSRIVNFWEASGFDKFSFAKWDSQFSVSSLSDFTAALFPISLIFLIMPLRGIKCLFVRIRHRDLVGFLIIVSCLISSLGICIMHPDFLSMFCFFSIYTMIYYGEVRREMKAHR